MIELTASQIAEIVQGKLVGTANISDSAAFEFDSRKIKPGDIFLALKGEKLDGHDFVADAIKNGATLSLVSHPVSGNYILVADVLKAVGALAHYVRTQLHDLKVVGITGSQGKTTTKDMLHSILRNEGQTVAALGSFNNDLGVPLTILRCSKSTQFCIVEMGARHGGDISALTNIAIPDIGAVLKVGNAHIGEFGSREKIAQTKGELIAGLKPGSIAVLGAYDEFTPQMKFAEGVKKITFGELQSCDIRAADIEFRGGFAHFDLVTPEAREPVELRVLGLHQIPNALAAAAIAFSLGIPTSRIASSLSMHENASKWRMEMHEGRGVLLINDSYNANPESMEAALRTLVLLTQERGGRAWAFLGTMHELGPATTQMHTEIGALAKNLGIDHLVAISNRDYLTGFSASQNQSHYFQTTEEAKSMFKEFEPGDVVLVKASRAEGLEQIASAIIQNWQDEFTENQDDKADNGAGEESQK